MNLIWFRLISNIIEKEIFFESIFICFFLWIEKMHCLRKGHLNPSKNLFFEDSENIIRIKKAIWIWIFQMDSENAFLTKRPSESEFFRWIQNLYSLLKGHLNLNFSDGFRNCIPGRKAIWIHLNLNFSDGLRKFYLSKKVTWIHLTLKFFHGYRKEILSFETTGKNVGGFDRSCFLLNDHLNPIHFQMSRLIQRKDMANSIHL